MTFADGGIMRADPFRSNSLYPVNKNTIGLTRRNTPINPALKTLVVILAGQSLNGGWCPTIYVPTNAANIDQFNMWDGSLYAPANDACLGGSGVVGAQGLGNLNLRLYDTLITNGKFDRVIFGITAVPSRSIYSFAEGGDDADKIGVMMRRLIWRGIAPGMTGTTWVLDWMIGESDNVAGMNRVTFRNGMLSANAVARAAGFAGKIIVHKETWVGSASTDIQDAQADVVGGDVYAGFNMDSLTGGTNRQGDNIHPTDVGAAAMATGKSGVYQAAGIFS